MTNPRPHQPHFTIYSDTSVSIVHALDRLPEPSADSPFAAVSRKAQNDLGVSLAYHQVDVRDVDHLNKVVENIAQEKGRLDGLVAAAGIQQETPALEYTAEDCSKMLDVNITGVFLTAQAVARQMIRLGNRGSMAFIASMSGTVANKGLICPYVLPFQLLALVPG